MQTIRPSLYSPGHDGFATVFTAARLFKHYVRIALAGMGEIISGARISLARGKRRGAVLDDRCPCMGNEQNGLPSESHPWELSSSTIARAANKSYGMANAPWINEAIKIRREDLF